MDTGRRKTSTTCQQARVHAQTEAAAARSSALAAEPRHPRSADAAKRQWTSCGSRSDRGARIWSRALHATISSGRTARAGTGNMAAALNNMPDEPKLRCGATCAQPSDGLPRRNENRRGERRLHDKPAVVVGQDPGVGDNDAHFRELIVVGIQPDVQIAGGQVPVVSDLAGRVERIAADELETFVVLPCCQSMT